MGELLGLMFHDDSLSCLGVVAINPLNAELSAISIENWNKSFRHIPPVWHTSRWHSSQALNTDESEKMEYNSQSVFPGSYRCTI